MDNTPEVEMASWSCEIGAVPVYRVPEGGDLPFRKAVQQAWEGMFPEMPSQCSSGWGQILPQTPVVNLTNDFIVSGPADANLGCATTEELFRELIARCSGNNICSFTRSLVLAEMLGGLDAQERDYRTID